MAQGTGNTPEEQKQVIQETLISVGAKISEAIRDAVQSAADNIDATIFQKLGKSLTTSFSNLAKFSEQAANNSFKISQGLLSSEGLSKQLVDLEEKKLTLARQKKLADDLGITGLTKAYNQSLKSLEAQERLLLSDKAITDSVEKRIGLTGKLAASIGQIPGLGKLVDAKSLEQELRKSAVVLDDSGNLIETNIGKIGMMGKGFSIVGSQIRKNILDPLNVVKFLVSQFLDINKASVDLQRLTGQLGTNMDVFANGAASATQILETQAEITRQVGLNAQNAFSYDVLANAADLKVEMGLAADEAGAFAMIAQTSGNSVDSVVDSVVSTTSAFNGANRSAISQGQILRDVAKTSNSIKLSLGNNPKALADAASQARRLGVDLNGLNNIASSLLDFESSIEKELEAQLLTGNQINLSKARELALNNDLEGVGKELFKNTVDIEKFGRMNRLQQDAQAAALGMTRDQLAQTAYLRGIESKMTSEQAAAAAGVVAEDMKRLEIQQNFTASLNKITAVLAPIMEKIGELMSIPFLGPAIAGAIIFIPMLGTIASSITSIIGLFTAKTAATVADTTATITQAGANTGLATSQTAVVTTGNATSGVFARMGTALGSFGASAAAASPVLLSIAAVAAGIGVAFAGVGFALMQIPKILEMITAEKAMGMILLGQAFSGLAVGLAAVALSGLAALPVLYGLKTLGLLGGEATAQTSVTESHQGAPQTMTFEPLVNEIKLMRQEMGSLLKQLVAKELVVKIDSYDVIQSCQISKVGQ